MTQIKATLIDHMGSDLSVVRSARVSFSKDSAAEGWDWYDYPEGGASGDFIAVLKESDKKLIKFLAKHEHYSPFNHTNVTFHVKAPIFVARQLVKHEYMPWNEISRRYVDDEPEFYVPDVWRGRSADKKQGSSDKEVTSLRFLGFRTETVHEGYERFLHHSQSLYKDMIDAGVCPEQARMVLPTSQFTEWYWSGTVKAFHKMCRLRCASDTQYESRIVAGQISKVMGELFPVSWTALMESEDQVDG